MEHHFNVELATMYGVNEAIFCHNIYFWIKKNQANKKHFYEGTYWTYNTNKAFIKLFPYWTTRQMRTVIENCEKKELIVKGNFNMKNYDQTLWYTITNKVLEIYEPKLFTKPFENPVKVVCQKCETVGTIELSDLTNGIVKIDKWNCQICQMELSDMTNGIVKIDKPIPDSKPYNKQTDNKPNNNKIINNKENQIEKSKKIKETIIYNWLEA